MKPASCVMIVDFGSQFTKLIARRIREIGVYSEIVSFSSFEEAFDRIQPGAVILSGSHYSIVQEGSPRISNKLFLSGKPVLGLCYGQQLMSEQLGGAVSAGKNREFGKTILEIKEDCGLFRDVWSKGTRHQVWMSHGDSVTCIPKGFTVLASSPGAPFAAIADESRQFYGLQFHPEVVHTPDGIDLLKNFVFGVAGLSKSWTVSTFHENAIETILQQAGEQGRVLCALSGGVDSSVAAALARQALGDRLVCVLVDHGMMRKNEARDVIAMFQNHYNLPVVLADASDVFLSSLEGVVDPESKRKIIGRLFIEVFEKEAKKLGGADFLVQGTLYPDVVESAFSANDLSTTVKSHHNVGGLPERMNMKLIEPLRELFKDEVRALGRELGLPEDFIGRHPFPGPGLAVRCPGAVTREKLDMLREIDSIYLDEIHKAGLYESIWQAFAVLLPVRSVGVMGDARTYEFACSLRAVCSVDGMTADFYPFDMSFLSRVSSRIVNEVQGVNRILYDITSKPPGTIEWE